MIVVVVEVVVWEDDCMVVGVYGYFLLVGDFVVDVDEIDVVVGGLWCDECIVVCG